MDRDDRCSTLPASENCSEVRRLLRKAPWLQQPSNTDTTTSTLIDSTKDTLSSLALTNGVSRTRPLLTEHDMLNERKTQDRFARRRQYSLYRAIVTDKCLVFDCPHCKAQCSPHDWEFHMCSPRGEGVCLWCGDTVWAKFTNPIWFRAIHMVPCARAFLQRVKVSRKPNRIDVTAVGAEDHVDIKATISNIEGSDNHHVEIETKPLITSSVASPQPHTNTVDNVDGSIRYHERKRNHSEQSVDVSKFLRLELIENNTVGTDEPIDMSVRDSRNCQGGVEFAEWYKSGYTCGVIFNRIHQLENVMLKEFSSREENTRKEYHEILREMKKNFLEREKWLRRYIEIQHKVNNMLKRELEQAKECGK